MTSRKPKSPKSKDKPNSPPEPRSKLRLEYRKPSELADNPANWRKHPKKQLDALEAVLADFGWAGVLLYNERTQRLIDGHARKSLASKTDEPVPVVIGNWTEEEERKILLSFDPLGSMAESNMDALKDLLAHVGASGDQIVEQLRDLHRYTLPSELRVAGSGGDEFDEPAITKYRSNPGDVWEFEGGHRLIVGDNGDPDIVASLFAGDRPSLLFTSPPYANQRNYGDAASKSLSDWDAMMQAAFTAPNLSDDAQILVNIGLIHRNNEWIAYFDDWIEFMRTQGWRRFAWYVWDQGDGLPGDWAGRLSPCFEFIFHFNKKTVYPFKVQECKDAGKIHGKSGLRDTDGAVATYTHRGKQVNPFRRRDAVIRANRNGSGATANGHPAPFPIKLPSQIIESWPGVVYDPFLGSGTTLVAAHRLKRVCYGCEIDPQYAECTLLRAEREGIAFKKRCK